MVNSSELADIGRRFYEFHTHVGLSQSAAAERAGIAHQTLARMAQGVNFSIDVLSKLKQAFPQLDLQWLLTGKGEMPPAQAVPVRIQPEARHQQILHGIRSLENVPPTATHAAIAKRTRKAVDLVGEALHDHHYALAQLQEITSLFLSWQYQIQKK
ncbi:MAG: helix-turn-helix transcriptional regulator [Bacteroidota bacterium]